MQNDDSIFLQESDSIQPRTSPPKFGELWQNLASDMHFSRRTMHFSGAKCKAPPLPGRHLVALAQTCGSRLLVPLRSDTPDAFLVGSFECERIGEIREMKSGQIHVITTQPSTDCDDSFHIMVVRNIYLPMETFLEHWTRKIG